MKFAEQITLTKAEALDLLAALDDATRALDGSDLQGLLLEMQEVTEMLVAKLDTGEA